MLTLLVTSPRVAPGLMTWAAWRAVAAPATVLASSADLPVVHAVEAAGHPVAVLDDASTGALLNAATSGAVVWLASDEEADRLPGELAAALVSGDTDVEVEVLHASYDVPGARLLDLVTVMDQLRLHCPWDREQTHRSLATYLVEEAYETLEAIESGDHEHLREELGDLLLQVYFHAAIAAEDGRFDIEDVAADLAAKLVRRNPHVFGDVHATDPAEIDATWQAIKESEKQRTDPLAGIPPQLPALLRAAKVLERLDRAGRPVRVDADATDIGERLLALVAEARAAGTDPEQALRDAVRRHTRGAP